MRAALRGQAVYNFLKQIRNNDVAEEVLQTAIKHAFNHAAPDVLRAAIAAAGSAGKVTRTRNRVGRYVWRFTPSATATIVPKVAQVVETEQLRGQGTLCKGALVITLDGPQGSGKSLVAKVLRALVPFLPVGLVTIQQRQ